MVVSLLVTAFISPYRQDRQAAREVIGDENFIEAYVNTPLEVCEARDPKGLYKKARSGEIRQFTGISDPFEAPTAPAVHVDTSELSVDQCVDRVLAHLQTEGVVGE